MTTLLGQFVGALPKLETICIKFPNYDDHDKDDDDDSEDESDSDSDIDDDDDNNTNQHNGNSVVQLLKCAIEKAPMLTWIEIHNLRLIRVGDEDELVDSFQNCNELMKLDIYNLQIIDHRHRNHNSHRHRRDYDRDDDYDRHDDYEDKIDIDVFFNYVCELPKLESILIHNRYKTKYGNRCTFYEKLCNMKGLKSLILWNVVTDNVQCKYICDGLTNSNSIERFEL